MSLFQMEGTSPEIRSRFLEIEQKRILVEMEAEQEAVEAARKKARAEQPADSGPPHDQTATAKTLVSLSHGRPTPHEVGIDDSPAQMTTCSIDIL